jgi:hydrogenase/urease accessory protein HupE
MATLRAMQPAADPRKMTPIARSWAAQHNMLRLYDDIAQAILGDAPAPAQAPPPAAPAPGAPPPASSEPATWSSFGHFVRTGVHHIFTGADHVLFIVTLMLTALTWRSLAILITSFTAAHSITLALATLGLVNLSSRIVEPLIAASVLFVAIDALRRPKAPARAPVTFAFGLLHGFGFSSVLRGLGLAGRELAPALTGFNVGVELGQLMIVLPTFPLILWLRGKPRVYERLRGILCVCVAMLAACWIVLRVREAMAVAPSP